MGDKITIAVLYGGTSIEREYSIKAAHYVSAILKQMNYKVMLIDFIYDKDYLNKIQSEEIDAAISLIYGCPGQEGTIQGLMEMLNIPYLGSDLYACSIIKDKVTAKTILQSNGIMTPRYLSFNKNTYQTNLENFLAQVREEIGYPLVIKPMRKGGLSLGIDYCVNETKLFDAIVEASQYDEELMLEQYISGIEIVATIINVNSEDINLPLIEVKKEGHISGYKEKQEGKRELIIPAQIDSETRRRVNDIAMKIFRMLKMKDYAYFDFMIGSDGAIHFIEGGTVPGLTENSNIPMALKYMSLDLGRILDDLFRKTIRSETLV